MMAIARRLPALSTAIAKYANPASGRLRMLNWLRKRRELIAAEADEFMEAHGNDAYFKAREEARAARAKGDHMREKFLAKVCIEIAKRTDFRSDWIQRRGIQRKSRHPMSPAPVSCMDDQIIRPFIN